MAPDTLYARVRATGGKCRVWRKRIRRGEPALRAGVRYRPWPGAEEVVHWRDFGTLLHEADHGLAHARKIGDTSRQGRYHNRRYASLAAELGLEVADLQPIGWSVTSVPEPTAARYVEVLAELAAALVLWRRAEQAGPAGPGRSRNALACSCACGRRIQVARSVLEQAPIVCAGCAQAFEPEGDGAG